jgi:hypothetical protein
MDVPYRKGIHKVFLYLLSTQWSLLQSVLMVLFCVFFLQGRDGQGPANSKDGSNKLQKGYFSIRKDPERIPIEQGQVSQFPVS